MIMNLTQTGKTEIHERKKWLRSTLRHLGALLRQQRGRRPLWDAAQEIGIHPSTLARVEHGRCSDLLTFTKVCAWLQIDPAEILGFKKDSGKRDEEEATSKALLHLHSDESVPQAAANDLAQLIISAHQELARRIREGLVNGSTRV